MHGVKVANRQDRKKMKTSFQLFLLPIRNQEEPMVPGEWRKK